jgi:hypothetical protein
MISLGSLGRILPAVLALVAFDLLPAGAQSSLTTPFDHFATSFPLTGTHISVSCASCHIRGRFNGTPTQCIGCHNTMTAPGEPQSHPRTTNRCEGCHLTTTWRDFRFIDHAQALGPCASCHNGKWAIGKPNNHIVTSAPCGNCHLNTVTFGGATVPAGEPAASPVSSAHAITPATVGPAATRGPRPADPISAAAIGAALPNARSPAARKEHSAVTSGCATCHNGAGALAKPKTHIATNAPCEACHKSTVTFAGARMNHTGIFASCITCHNGTAAVGKPATQHIMTNAPCEACHKSSATFAGARVDHTLVTAPCASCHNGTMAEGKSPHHFVTPLPCGSCHRTSSWVPADYRHASPAYVNHGPAVSCLNCHVSNTQVVLWKFPALRQSCAGCHADKYRPMAHAKFQRPVRSFYTVTELKDCSGSCHTFANNTQRTVLARSFAVHRSPGGGW